MGRRCGGEGTNSSSAYVGRLAHKELRAWTRLAKLWQDGGEEGEVERCLRGSLHLLALVPDPPASPSAAQDWSDLIAAWALVATRAHRWRDAEEALQVKRRVAKVAGGTDLEASALKELAVCYRRLGDEATLKDTINALSPLLEGSTRDKALRELWQELQHLQPIGGESRAKEDEALQAAAAAELAAVAAQHPPPEQEEPFRPTPRLLADYRPFFGPEPPPGDASSLGSWEDRAVPGTAANVRDVKMPSRWKQLCDSNRLSVCVFVAAVILAFVCNWLEIGPHWIRGRPEL